MTDQEALEMLYAAATERVARLGGLNTKCQIHGNAHADYVCPDTLWAHPELEPLRRMQVDGGIMQGCHPKRVNLAAANHGWNSWDYSTCKRKPDCIGGCHGTGLVLASFSNYSKGAIKGHLFPMSEALYKTGALPGGLPDTWPALVEALGLGVSDAHAG